MLVDSSAGQPRRLPAKHAVHVANGLMLLATPPAGPAAASAPPGPRVSPRRVLVLTTMGTLLVVTNSTAISVALPQMSADLHASAATADWFLLAFLLTMSASILVVSKISDVMGRKRLYVLGLVGFTVASLIGALATSPGEIVAVRAVQGVMAAMTTVNSAALIAEVYPAHRLTGALGMTMVAAGVANATGPGIGGLLVESFGWRSIFVMNVPFGVIGTLLALRGLPPSPRAHWSWRTFDGAGAVLSTIGAGLLVIGIHQGAVHSFADPVVLLALASGAVCVVLMILVERAVRDPIVDLSVARGRRLLVFTATFCNSFARGGIVIAAVLYVQLALGGAPSSAGLIGAIVAAPIIVGSPVGGRLADWFSLGGISAVGGLLATAGCVVVWLSIATHAGLAVLSIGLVLSGLGVGVFTAPNTGQSMRDIDHSKRTITNGVRGLFYNIAQILSTTVTLLLISSGLGGATTASYAVSDGPAPPGLTAGFLKAVGVISVVAVGAAAASWLGRERVIVPASERARVPTSSGTRR